MKQHFIHLYFHFRKWFSNLPLQKKIQLISISCLLLLTGSSILITGLLLRQYNDLVLDSVSASLSYANDDFSRRLDDMEKLTYTSLSDPTLQSQLSLSPSAAGSTQKADLYTRIKSRLHSYYQEHEQEYISWLSLYTSQFDCHTSTNKIRFLTDEQIDTILESAHKAAGKAVWITDSSNGGQLLLAREIRRYSDLSLQPLGTLIVGIDLDSMISSCSMFSEYDSFFYRITDEQGRFIYDSLSLNAAENGDAGSTFRYRNTNGGHLLTIYSGHWYLSLSGQLTANGWQYHCLVSYDNIRNTMNAWRMTTVLLLLASCMLIVIASRFIIRSQTRHFGILIRKMQKFASSPDTLTAFSPESRYDYENRHDEIGMLHRQFDRMAVQISDLIESNYAKELLVKETRLRALEMQINPHFLFNTLESINWRAKAANVPAISQMTEALGNLFRAVLSRSGEHFTIAEELALVDHYLIIQKYRFGSRLVYSVDADPALMKIPVPKLTIQPLVENAVSHSMDSLCEECKIDVQVRRSNSLLEILVRNTGSSFENDLLSKLRDKTILPKGFGIGLLNIDRRLRLMYGRGCLFLFNENHMATACIRLPLNDIPETDQRGDDRLC